MKLLKIIFPKKPTLEEQLQSLTQQIEQLKGENRTLASNYLSQLELGHPPQPKQKKIHNFVNGYVRVLDDRTGDYYILDNYGNKTKEDYHHLQQSPNSTHLQAAQEMGESPETETGNFNTQGTTDPDTIGRGWQQTVQSLRPAINRGAKKLEEEA